MVTLPRDSRARQDILRIQTALMGARSNFRGLRILDLGCGSERGAFQNGIGMPPYFARHCAEEGGIVFGIDCYPASEADGALYTHITRDLVPLILRGRIGEIVGLDQHRFDIIHSRGLTSDPSDPTLARILRNKKVRADVFQGKLVEETAKLVVEGGILSVEDSLFRKTSMGWKESSRQNSINTYSNTRF